MHGGTIDQAKLALTSKWLETIDAEDDDEQTQPLIKKPSASDAEPSGGVAFGKTEMDWEGATRRSTHSEDAGTDIGSESMLAEDLEEEAVTTTSGEVRQQSTPFSMYSKFSSTSWHCGL